MSTTYEIDIAYPFPLSLPPIPLLLRYLYTELSGH